MDTTGSITTAISTNTTTVISTNTGTVCSVSPVAGPTSAVTDSTAGESRKVDMEAAIRSEHKTSSVVRLTSVISFLMLLTAYFTFSIYWGVHYLDFDCEYMLATWSIIFGITGVTITLIITTRTVYSYCKCGNHKESFFFQLSLLILGILILFAIGWLVMGASFVYQMVQHGYSVCPTPLYLFVLCSVSILLGIIGLLIGLFVCLFSGCFDVMLSILDENYSDY